METQEAQRKIGLDYLRAVAILCVLTAHTAGQNPLQGLGFIGVEVFFVLSGYLIGGILLRTMSKTDGGLSWHELQTFWVRRWLRTMPNYFLFLPLYIAAEQFGWRRELWLYASFTQNLAWPMGRLFSVSWSLTIEEWFYLLLPVMLLMGLRIVSRLKPAVILSIGVMFVIPFVLRLTVYRGLAFDAGLRKIVVLRLDALMWGVALAAIERYCIGIFDRLCSLLCVTVGVAGLLLEAWWVWARYQQRHDFPATIGGAFILTGVSFFAALLLPYCSKIPWKKSLWNRAACLVSLWSYSIYLSHGLLIWISQGLLDDPQMRRWVTIMTAWTLTLSVSAGVYYLFEKPILRWRDRVSSSH